MNERRRDRRFPLEASAVLKIGKKPQLASVVNVSFHGLSMTVDEPPPLRQLVQVELDLPTGKSFSVHAMVVHVEANRIGLEFFGRNSNPDWDEFMQSLVRASLLPPAPQQIVQGRPPPRPPPPPPSKRSAAITGGAPQGPPNLPPQGPPHLPPQGPPHLPPQGPPHVPSSPSNLPPQGPPNFAPAAPPPLPGPPNLPMHVATPNAHGSGANHPSQAPPNFANPGALPLPPSNPANAPVTPAPQAQASQPASGPPTQAAMLRAEDPPYQGQEKRRSPRINMQLELRLRTPRAIHTAFTRSVSMMGATLVIGEGQVGVGEQVIVNLIQPGTNFSFKRDGVVRRAAPGGDGLHVGVEFTALDAMREVLFADFMNTAYATLSSG